FAQKERGPKGPIPTKFTGRVYGLDDQSDAAGADDEALPDFMKAETATDDATDDAVDVAADDAADKD
ncbi:MAG TPA: hypothetical protein VMW48_08075, partial [Vicinamibacterales bacterium]|nr:hypothetical protein [Vicinamibacterales bacterium]